MRPALRARSRSHHVGSLTPGACPMRIRWPLRPTARSGAPVMDATSSNTSPRSPLFFTTLGSMTSSWQWDCFMTLSSAGRSARGSCETELRHQVERGGGSAVTIYSAEKLSDIRGLRRGIGIYGDALAGRLGTSVASMTAHYGRSAPESELTTSSRSRTRARRSRPRARA